MILLAWKLLMLTVEGSRLPVLWLLLRPIAGLLPLIVIISGYVEDGFGLLLLFATCVTSSVNLAVRSAHRLEKQIKKVLNLNFTKLGFSHEISFVLRIFWQAYIPFILIATIIFFPSYFPDLIIWMSLIVANGFVLILFVHGFRKSISKIYARFPDFYQASRYYAPAGFVISFVALNFFNESDILLGLILGLTPVGLMTSPIMLYYGSISEFTLLVSTFFSSVLHGSLCHFLNRVTRGFEDDHRTTDFEIEDL